MFLSKQLYGVPGKTCRQLFSAHTPNILHTWNILAPEGILHACSKLFSPELIYHITEGKLCVCEREHTTFM